MIRTEIDSMPTELDVIQRKIIQHEIEEAALKKEDDAISKEHLAEIQKELAEMRDEFNAKKAQWENEKNAISKVQKLREDLEAANAQLEKAQREYDLNKAAELQYGKHPRAAQAAGGGGGHRQRGQGPLPAAGQGHRGGDRPHHRALDRHSGGQADGGRA